MLTRLVWFRNRSLLVPMGILWLWIPPGSRAQPLEGTEPLEGTPDRAAEMVAATEKVLNRRWSEMTVQHGDWGRNGLMAVATRHLGWRLVDVVREIPGLGYGAAAQGIRRFWTQLPQDPEKAAFRNALVNQMSKVQI